MSAQTRRFEFDFSPMHLVASAGWGILPATAWVDVDDELRVRFGPWSLRTPTTNVEWARVTGPYEFVRVAGPARLSLADRGLTFATNGLHGVCIGFRTPVSGFEPTGLLKHPGLTVTVAEPEELVATLLRSRDRVYAARA